MSEAEKSKPNKESTSALTTTPASSAATTTKVSSGTNATTNSSSSITTSTTNSNSGSSSSSSSSSSSNSNSTIISNTSITSKLLSKPPPPLPPPPPPPPKLLPPPAPVSRPRSHEHSETVIKKTFLDLMKDPECLDKAADYLYESLLEDAVMGVYLEVHHSVKSGALEAIEGQLEDDTAFKIMDTPNYDVFGMSTARKAMDCNCNCPNCDRLVAASRFAPHLLNCMGMGRKTSRIASRRLANAKEGSNSSYFSSNISDDEDDADWSSEKRRKKIQTSRTNGSKKNGKTS